MTGTPDRGIGLGKGCPFYTDRPISAASDRTAPDRHATPQLRVRACLVHSSAATRANTTGPKTTITNEWARVRPDRVRPHLCDDAVAVLDLALLVVAEVTVRGGPALADAAHGVEPSGLCAR